MNAEISHWKVFSSDMIELIIKTDQLNVDLEDIESTCHDGNLRALNADCFLGYANQRGNVRMLRSSVFLDLLYSAAFNTH